MQKMHTKIVSPKGDRLNWTPLKEVKPVLLNAPLTKGRMLSSDELDKVKKKNLVSKNILIP